MVEYQTQTGVVPYRVWFDGLRDRSAQARLDARIARLRAGNFGQAREVGEGVVELKLDFGPGYRVYVGQFGNELVVLLAGGDKSSQERDIQHAKINWHDLKARNRREEAASRKPPRKTIRTKNKGPSRR